ncbi:MAG: HD domain-containing protein, partial [Minisyncoccia bacterium]
MTNRDIEFLFEIGSMKNVDRSWSQMLGMKCATNLEHSFRVAFVALLIARREAAAHRAKGISEEKILKMALIHDLPEARTQDLHYIGKVYASTNDEKAAADLFAGTTFRDLNEDILHEYERRESFEARAIKDADNLDVDIELKELEERGSALPKKWAANRRIVR